jgi:hypothetical protein
MRLIAFAMLIAVAGPAAAQVQKATPKMVECHDAATKRYIEGFRQIGARERVDGRPLIVTGFENDPSRYEQYLTECLERVKHEQDR